MSDGYRIIRESTLSGFLARFLTPVQWVRVQTWFRRQPDGLVGATAAAEILGVQTPHLARLREQGRMPEGIRVEGSYDVYVKRDVQKLARALQRERAERARRKEDADE